jgi:hypothetical protein
MLTETFGCMISATTPSLASSRIRTSASKILASFVALSAASVCELARRVRPKNVSM